MNRLMGNLALACALLVQAACSHAGHSAMHLSHSAMPAAAEGFSREMHAGMHTMMKRMNDAGHTGNPDVDFLEMMIPHHEGAVDMARLELAYGKDPLARRLAEEIIASQTAEIAAMKERLTVLRRGEDPNPGGFPALHGTRGVAPQ
jgi:uncharacterized protein (DUF305 family)